MVDPDLGLPIAVGVLVILLVVGGIEVATDVTLPLMVVMMTVIATVVEEAIIVSVVLQVAAVEVLLRLIASLMWKDGSIMIQVFPLAVSEFSAEPFSLAA